MSHAHVPQGGWLRRLPITVLLGCLGIHPAAVAAQGKPPEVKPPADAEVLGALLDDKGALSLTIVSRALAEAPNPKSPRPILTRIAQGWTLTTFQSESLEVTAERLTLIEDGTVKGNRTAVGPGKIGHFRLEFSDPGIDAGEILLKAGVSRPHRLILVRIPPTPASAPVSSAPSPAGASASPPRRRLESWGILAGVALIAAGLGAGVMGALGRTRRVPERRPEAKPLAEVRLPAPAATPPLPVPSPSLDRLTGFLDDLTGAMRDEIPRLPVPAQEQLDHLYDHLRALRAEVETLTAVVARSEAQVQWKAVQSQSIDPIFEEVRQLADESRKGLPTDLASILRAHLRRGHHGNPEERVDAVLRRWGPATTRDLVVALLELVDEPQVTQWSSDAGRIGASLKRLCDLAGIRLIGARPGDSVDHTRHEFEPSGRRSEYPRGSVVRLVRHGYEWNGATFRRARVEISAGNEH